MTKRWVPNYAIYRLVHEGEPGAVVSPAFDDGTAAHRKALQSMPVKHVSDANVVARFTQLRQPETTLEDVAKFIIRFGALGGLTGKLPEEVGKRFGQTVVELKESRSELLAGFGPPIVNHGGSAFLVTVPLYQRIARFVAALLTIGQALRLHGQTPWESYAKRKDVADSLKDLEDLGFHGSNMKMMAALEEAAPPDSDDDPAIDDLGLALARIPTDEREGLVRQMVEVAPGHWERTGPIDAGGRAAIAKAVAWQKYWAALQRAGHGPAFAPAALDRFKRRADTHRVENAAKWFVSATDIRAELVGDLGTFKLRYTAVTSLQAIALAVAANLTQSGGRRLQACRLCNAAFAPQVGRSGGRPRTLCDGCYDVRTAKTVCERLRRSAVNR